MPDEPQLPITGDTPPADPRSPGLLERMIKVFLAPREAFAGRIPASAWILPLVLVAAVQATEGYLLRPLTTERVQERLEEVDMSPEMRERALESLQGERQEGPAAWLLGLLGSVVGLFLLGLLVPALFYWIGSNFLFGGSARFGAILSVVGLSSLVYIPKAVITLPLKLSQNSLDIYTSLALLPVAEVGTKLRNAMNVFDFFEIWFVVVAGIGLAQAAGIRRGQGWTITFIVWGVWALVRIIAIFLLTGTTVGTLLGL
ncbi:MAG: hypothetical protein GF355_11785 [Candidatus Eisenbacteria bacterium]|nr:hypothetical protein [Candidatus Eisenbacteria bacterium]